MDGTPPISERWLGSHKTVIGADAGISVALIAAFVQSRIQWSGSLVDYDRWPLIGLLLGAGAIGGDMVKSFFKRRLKIAPGDRWIPPINWILELARCCCLRRLPACPGSTP